MYIISARSSPVALGRSYSLDTDYNYIWSMLKSAPNESGMQKMTNAVLGGKNLDSAGRVQLEEKGILFSKNEWFLR